MSGNVGIGTTPSSSNALTVNGALNIINNPTNPGNTYTASFWNQATIGPTISGLNLSVQTNGIYEAMRINSSGNAYFNGCVGIGTNTINSGYQLQLPYNASYATQLRCEGGSGIVPLSIGGNGSVYVDAPSFVGGRFTILNGGNVGIGSINPQYTLDVNGNIASSSYIYAGGTSSTGLRLGGFDTYNTIYQANGNIGISLNYTNTPSGSINLGFFGGNGNNILSVSNSSVNISQPTNVNSTLTASGRITGNLYYCTMPSVAFSYQSAIGSGGTYGFFIEMNGWWYLGYSYLTVSASIVMGGNNTYCWNGRVFLSPSAARTGYATILTNGGVMNIITDYASPSSGPYYMNPQSAFDGSGNNFLYFSNTYLNAGICNYKIYG